MMRLVDFLVILSMPFLVVVVVSTTIPSTTTPIATSTTSTAKGNEEWGNEEECVNPLGMESGKIPTSRITASSSFDVKSVGPQNARVRQELHGGAWCPRSTIERGVKEYLEIDLSGNHRITQTETQGRFGNGLGQEFAESFELEYWRDSLGKWISYKNHLGHTIMEANKNTYIGAIQQLTPPIVASRLRFIPYSEHPRTICMRVEAYGCHYSRGVIHYECPQGYWKKNPDVDLRDVFYDGWMDEDEILHGGLGILTDTFFGPTDFRAAQKNKGSSWIGWDNQSKPIKIGFQFDQIRRFHHISIHVNNLVSQGAQVFASLDIYFSVDGQKFSEFPLRWTPKGDMKNETAQMVTVPLRGRLANSLRLELTHANHWLLLSEVFFSSEIFTGNVTDDIIMLNYLQDGPEDEDSSELETKNSKKKMDSKSRTSNSHGAMIGLIVGSLSVFVILTVVTLVCYVLKRSRRNTKLVAVLGLTPKSMSMGLSGIANSNDSTSQGQYSSHNTKSPGMMMGNGKTGNTKHGTHKGKIALCDLRGSGTMNGGTTESDESLYHELVFSLHGYNNSSNKNEDCNASSTTTKRGGRDNFNRKIKYQRVNHAGEFSDFMGVRSIHDELTSFPQQQQQRSQPSTPTMNPKLKCYPVILPPPPPGVNSYQHRQFSLRPKSGSSTNVNNGNNSPGSLFTTTSSKHNLNGVASSVGFFNSPHVHRPTIPSHTKKNMTESSYYAATDIFHVPSSQEKHFERF